MSIQQSSCALAVVFIVAHLFAPISLWASEQSDFRTEASDRALISAMRGEQLTVQSSAGSKTLRFRDTVDVGDQIATGDRTVADVLIGRRAVVTLRESTTMKLVTMNPAQTIIKVTQGGVRVAASATALGEQDTITIQTPNGQVQTRGGIVRVMVNEPVDAAEHTLSGEAKPYLVSASSNMMLAELNTRGDIVQVKEGLAEIAGAGPGDEALTVQAGQQVMLKAGQAESIAALMPLGDMRAEVLASADHANTPQQGREHLVALQVDQATQLGHALTGTVETCQDDSVMRGIKPTGTVKTCQEDPTEKDNVQNAIIGPTGGVKLVSTLFGDGTAFNSASQDPIDSTGSGFSVQSNNNRPAALLSTAGYKVRINGGENALLAFTKKEPVRPSFVIETITLENFTFKAGSDCDFDCVEIHERNNRFNDNIDIKPMLSSMNVPLIIPSKFTVDRELVLMGGTGNNFHGGIAPTEKLIIRGAGEKKNSNIDIPPTLTLSPNVSPILGRITQQPPARIVEANSTFVIRNGEICNDMGDCNSTLGIQGDGGTSGSPLHGGILGQFANDKAGPANTFLGANPTTKELEGNVTRSIDKLGEGVTGAITATNSIDRPLVTLLGGVTLDRGTEATIGTTEATNNYDTSLGGTVAKFSGSLLAIIDGPNNVSTAVIVKDRLLGVYDGSKVLIPDDGKNMALLSVLDAKLKLDAPPKVPLIDIDAAFKDANKNNGEGGQPEVTVTSAVVTRSTKQLDRALLEASAPLLVLTKATMSTTSHFADLAGNQAPSIQLNDALVALNDSKLTINGNLLNLNNAKATVNGYLFSLNNGSTLTINGGTLDGTLFSLNNGSSLNLNNANAFGVFGSGTNTLSIKNDLCAASACGTLVNSVHMPFTVDGSELHVAGVTQDVVLPDGFNVFAAAKNAQPPDLDIAPDAALFHVDSNSTLTINGTDVVSP